jgi:hypothetical protein
MVLRMLLQSQTQTTVTGSTITCPGEGTGVTSSAVFPSKCIYAVSLFLRGQAPNKRSHHINLSSYSSVFFTWALAKGKSE